MSGLAEDCAQLVSAENISASLAINHTDAVVTCQINTKKTLYCSPDVVIKQVCEYRMK
jgi:hypothetical protein